MIAKSLAICLIAAAVEWGGRVWGGDAPSAPAGPSLMRIGDPGSVFDPSLADERFPEMAEWAKAGVEGGIPDVQRVVATLKPGDDLYAAVASADVAVGRLGVLLLQPGTYTLPTTLKLKPGLIVRGADRAGVVLSSTMTTGISVIPGDWSALEDLTVLNALVKARPESEYIGKYSNGGPSDACTVWFGGSNAWLQRCDVLYAGKDPIGIHNHRISHLTIRDCLIDKAFNKGSGGAGYFDISTTRYVLLYNTTIRNIRHLSIMFDAQYLVVYACRLEVDLNYHDGCPKHTLVEKTVVARRPGHHWSSICYGWEPWQDDGPGPRNFIFNSTFDDGRASDGKHVYVLRDTTAKYKNMPVKEPMVLEFGPAPAKGTLYAVTGRHIPAEEVQKGKVNEQMLSASRARDWARTVLYANTLLRIAPAEDPLRAKASDLLAEANRLAAEALVKLKARPTPSTLRAFQTTWAGTAAAGETTAIAADAARAEWAKLTVDGKSPTSSALRVFLADWSGIAPVDEATAQFEALAEADLAKRKNGLASPAAVQSFAKQWPGTRAATAAATAFTERLRTVLADLVAKKAKMTAKERQDLAAQFAGTALEAEAKRELGGK